MNKIHIFQCMGKIFCVEFQRYPLKFHTKYLTHTLKDMIFMQFLEKHVDLSLIWDTKTLTYINAYNADTQPHNFFWHSCYKHANAAYKNLSAIFELFFLSQTLHNSLWCDKRPWLAPPSSRNGLPFLSWALGPFISSSHDVISLRLVRQPYVRH